MKKGHQFKYSLATKGDSVFQNGKIEVNVLVNAVNPHGMDAEADRLM